MSDLESDLEQRLLEAAKNDWVYIDNRILLQEAADTLAKLKQLRDLEYYYADACKRIEEVREWAKINIDLQPATDFSRGFQGAANRVLAILDRSETSE